MNTPAKHPLLLSAVRRLDLILVALAQGGSKVTEMLPYFRTVRNWIYLNMETEAEILFKDEKTPFTCLIMAFWAFSPS